MYNKTTWVNNSEPYIESITLNNIENGIESNDLRTTTNDNSITDLDTRVGANETQININTVDIASLQSGEHLQGSWNPSITEYPPAPEFGYSWYVVDLVSPYVFTTGDLTGQTAHNHYKMIFGSLGWTLITYSASENVLKAGDTMTGPLNVPAGATGTEVPQAQEVAVLDADNVFTGDNTIPGTFTGDLTGTVTGDLTGTADLTGLQLQGQNMSPYSNRNKIINGDFSIWERGGDGNYTGNYDYICDRWRLGTDSVNYDSWCGPSASVPNEHTVKAIYIGTSNVTGPTWFHQDIEEIRNYANQTMTASFWAKHSGGPFDINLKLVIHWDGSPNTALTPHDFIVDTDWAYYTASFDIPSSNGMTIGANSSLGVVFGYEDAQAGSLYFSNIQFEVGPVATSFEVLPYGQTLALCQRYYEKWSGSLLPVPYVAANGALGDKVSNNIAFNTTKRVHPTVSGTLADGVWNLWGTTIHGFGLYATQNGNSTCTITSWQADAEL